MLALFFIGSCICILLDQLSKYFVYTSLRLSESIPLIKGLFQLTYCENRGAAFGVLQNQIWLFVLITIIVIGGVLLFMLKKKPKEGTELYAVIYNLYISQDILTSEDLCHRLNMSRRKFYYLRKKAIDLIAIRLWGAPNDEILAWLEIMEALEKK